MDIRKPKPIHNGREFLKEVGTIVIGVCIALAAEQAVEWWHWRGQVAEARKVIATEMAYNVEGAIIRLRVEGCIESRLDELSHIVDAAAKSGTLPPVGDIGLPPRNLFTSGAWESVVASQTATHFPRQQLADISHTYRAIETLGKNHDMEFTDWRDLYTIVGPGRRLDPISEGELRKALSRVRGSARAMTSLGGVVLVQIKNLNLSFSPDDLAGIARARHVPLAGTKQPLNVRNSTVAICSPIGTVPPIYGQAQFSYLPSMLDGMVKAIPDFSSGTK